MRRYLFFLSLLSVYGELLIEIKNCNCTGSHSQYFSQSKQYACGINSVVNLEVVLVSGNRTRDVSFECLFQNTLLRPVSSTMLQLQTLVEQQRDSWNKGNSVIIPTISCSTSTNETTTVNVPSLSIYPRLPSIDSISMTRTEKSSLLGINSSLKLQLVNPSPGIISSSCVILNRTYNSNSAFNVKILENDPTVLPNSLAYNCTLYDAASNPAAFKVGNVSNTPLISGALPTLKLGRDIRSSETPARIGTVMDIPLLSPDSTLLQGNCSVNNQSGLILQAPSEDDDDDSYHIVYVVKEAASPLLVTFINITCDITNSFGNKAIVSLPSIPYEIDPSPPIVSAVSLLFSSDSPAKPKSVIEVQILSPEVSSQEYHTDFCEINNVDIAKSFTASATPGSYLLTYVVQAGDLTWNDGQLGINCILSDDAGNTLTLSKINSNSLRSEFDINPVTFQPSPEAYLPDKLLVIGFFIVAVAAHTIAKQCPKIGLPVISGYLLTGILAGPYVLALIEQSEISQLRFIDEMSLGYIGLAAGNKLHWKSMQPMVKSVGCVTLALILCEFVIGSAVMLLLSTEISFLRNMKSAERYAIALLGGCMMIARSPSSALAIIEEVKATGRFTTLTFAVTVVCDALVIVLFNITSMLTEAILTQKSFTITAVLQVLGQILLSIVYGVLCGKLLLQILKFHLPCIRRKSFFTKVQQFFKKIFILLFGFGTFVLSHEFKTSCYFEPLLGCLVAGMTLRNGGGGGCNREEISRLVSSVASFVYVCFFTLSGAALEIRTLVNAIVVSVALCLTRILAIAIGSYAGGRLAGECKRHNNVAWMAYVTQAGVTLGLAKQIQLLYPGWGSYFCTFIIAVVICNQIIGPLLLRHVLKLVGDARTGTDLKALILSDGDVSSLNERMSTCGWSTTTTTVINDSSSFSAVEAMLGEVEPLDVVIIKLSENATIELIRTLAAVCNKQNRVEVLRIVVAHCNTSISAAVNDDEDAIDVIVIDQSTSSDIVIELAARGKTSVLQLSSSPKRSISLV